MTVPPAGAYPPPQDYPDAPARTNGLAVASLVCAFLFSPLGAVFGHMSLWQIKRSGDKGRGLAIAGLVISYLVIISAIVAVVLGVVVVRSTIDELDRQMYPQPSSATAAPPPSTVSPPSRAPRSGDALPPFQPPAGLGSDCQYPADGPAAKPNTPPHSGPVPREPATVPAGIVTNQGSIGLVLANGQAPCTVNNFASLALQGYFDGTSCHRLTSGGLSVLQCGDPTGTGSGGPGYQFADEYPVNQYPPSDPALNTPVRYPRGTVAMANAGPGTNGSQFFLLYQDSQLPPTYTVFGTVDKSGLATLDKIAAGGVEGGASDGAPATPVTIASVNLD